jgi:16S rRNA G966 N2-methylase RsmD
MLFPYTENYNKLQYDEEGIWSITLPNDADKISKIIRKEINKNSIIVDATCGLGGNILSFSKYFKKVIGIEVNKTRFNMLLNNICVYKINNVFLINKDCINIINNFKFIYNGLFIDPPWGGPNYKLKKKLRLQLNSYNIIDIIKLVKNINPDIKIFIKLPYNYDFTEFFNMNYRIYKINNFILLVIL